MHSNSCIGCASEAAGIAQVKHRDCTAAQLEHRISFTAIAALAAQLEHRISFTAIATLAAQLEHRISFTAIAALAAQLEHRISCTAGVTAFDGCTLFYNISL